MRSIFLTLIALNLVLLVIQLLWLRPPTDSPVSQVAPLQGSPLRMLREPGADNIVRPRREAQPLVPEAAVGAGREQCALVGAFGQRLEAERFVEHLRALEVNASVRELEVPDGSSYWVHLPPEISKQAALRRLYELQAKQVDSYIIPRGELANGISLGMFTRRELAHQRLEELRALGYPAEILEVSRSLREIWVVLPLPESEKLAASLWQELLVRQPGLEKRQNLCPSVASG